MATKGSPGTKEQPQPGDASTRAEVDSSDALRDWQQRLDNQGAQMQTPAHRKAVDALFAATSEELGEAAVRSAASQKAGHTRK